MVRCGQSCYHKSWNLLCNRGGGSKPQPAQIIPAPQAPNYAETAAQSAEARLKYDPQLTQQSFDLSSQYAPLYKALTEQLYPQLPTFSNQVTQQLQSPQGLTPEQSQAQQAIRQRAFDQSAQGIRESANLGGNLYGGRRELREDRARNELAQGFATQDIALNDVRRQQGVSNLQTLLQLTFPQVQQQSIGGNPDALYSALVQNQGNFGVIQPGAGTPGLGGPAIGAAGSIAAAKIFVMCLSGQTLIDTPNGPVAIKNIEAGDEVVGGKVLFKSAYAPAPTQFVALTLSDGTVLETCSVHYIEGHEAQTYQPGDSLGNHRIVARQDSIRPERTYDLLTAAPDGSYRVAGVQVASMIPTMHKIAAQLQEVA